MSERERTNRAGSGVSASQYARVQCEIIRFYWRNEKIDFNEAVTGVTAYLNAIEATLIDGMRPLAWIMDGLGQ